MLFVVTIKFPTDNSKRLMNDNVAVNKWLVESYFVSRIQWLKGFSGRITYCSRAYITSHAVFEASQKKGGDSHHPICRKFGTTMLISSISFVRANDWSTYLKFHISCPFTCRRQNLPFMSSFAKQNGRLVLWLYTKVYMSLFTHGPKLYHGFFQRFFVSFLFGRTHDLSVFF